MKVNILFFGQLTDVTGTTTLVLENIIDTKSLAAKLQQAYPGLDAKKYIIAVNSNQVTENTLLSDNCTVALLPPFSGG